MRFLLEIKKRIKEIMQNSSEITKIVCELDKVFYQEEGNLGELIMIPAQYTGRVHITLNNKTTQLPIEVLKKVLNTGDSKSHYDQYPDLARIKEILKDDSDNVKEHSYDFGKLLSYKDITDYEFNNFEKIEQATLTSDGLWIGNGIRKIELEFDSEFNNFIACARKKSEDEDRKISCGAFFDKKNNDTLEKPIEFNIQRHGKVFFVLLDTDKLMEYFTDSIATHTFYGKIKITIKQEAMGTRDEKVAYSFYFPFEIKMKNPKLSETHQSTEQIAIDFGTSSTCVARNKGKDLLSFNDNPTGILDYENMTALILYNWKSIYASWQSSNSTIPMMKRSKHEADEIEKDDQFNYGDKIKWELENVPTARTMDAIITKLKSLPAKLENNKTQKEEVIPFDKDSFKNKVYLTDKVEDESDEILNPIALYGYLIGRSLNLQIEDKIYTQFNLTMPVNFNTYQKERIRASLAYGLKRAIPKGLKDALVVKNDYEESVALLGVAKRLKHLKPENGKEAALFAVFDFGGGTLDFAFGLYRKSSDEENIAVFEDEENRYDNIIEIFKTDGELVGGETLIESLSYKIYKDYQEIMKENKIPIYLPDGEVALKNYPKNLFGNRHIDHVNLKSLNETFSREFFIGKGEEEEGKKKKGGFSKTKVELFPIDGKNGKEIDFSELKEESAEEFLDEKIDAIVKNFKNIIEETFQHNLERIKEFGFESFNIDDVKVLQAGNACKARWIKNAFKKYFENGPNIIFLEDEKREITPKNAVAKGALMLGNIGVFNHSKIEGDTNTLMPLDRYIWDFSLLEEEGDEAKATLTRGATSKLDWKSISRINNNLFTIYYSAVATLEDEEDENLFHYTITIPDELLEEGKYSIWARPYDGKFIECVLGNKKGDNRDETKKMIIDLDSGEIIK